jgi:hypothetical protein
LLLIVAGGLALERKPLDTSPYDGLKAGINEGAVIVAGLETKYARISVFVNPT